MMKAGSPERARALLESTLSHAEELGLSEGQIATLSRFYWGARAGQLESDIISDIISVLSPDQLRVALGYFLESSEEPETVGVAPETVDALVVKSLDKITKDRSVVEVELATKVADRLITWSKTFGFFVAVPVAILLLILSLFGISKFEDARKAAEQADKVLQQAEARSTALEKAGNKISEQIDRVQQVAQENERKLGELAQRQEKTERSVQELLGGLSAGFETGNKGPGFVFGGTGGKSYGTWGMNQQNAGRFVTQPAFPWHREFEGLAPGSPEFDAAWRALGDRESAGFKEAQRVFVQKAVYDPVAEKLKELDDLDLNTRSRALQDVVFAVGVLVGPQVLLIQQACQKLREQGKWNLSDQGFDEALIRQIYQVLSDRMPQFRSIFERQTKVALTELTNEQRPAEPRN
jgi:TolA-binding protein